MLLLKPQLSGSFVLPSMQAPPLSDSAGSEQSVKSALI